MRVNVDERTMTARKTSKSSAPYPQRSIGHV